MEKGGGVYVNLNVVSSGRKCTEKNWVRFKTRHCALQGVYVTEINMVMVSVYISRHIFSFSYSSISRDSYSLRPVNSTAQINQ